MLSRGARFSNGTEVRNEPATRVRGPIMPQTVLIVEDDPDILDIHRNAFENAGFRVVLSTNPLQAATLIDKSRFDGLVIDIKMPGMNGLQLAHNVRSGKLNSKTPILIVSGFFNDETLERASKLKLVQSVKKPFKSDEVVKILKIEMEKKNPTSSTYDIRILNPFIAGFGEILKFYLGNSVAIGSPFLKLPNQGATSHISAVMNLVGPQVKGTVSITFDNPFLAAAAAKVFAGMPVATSAESYGDLASELCNQVCGKVKINLRKQGIKVVIGLPHVISGKEYSVSMGHNGPVLVIPAALGNDKGKCHLEFCLTAAQVDEAELIDEEDMGSIDSGVVLF